MPAYVAVTVALTGMPSREVSSESPWSSASTSVVLPLLGVYAAGRPAGSSAGSLSSQLPAQIEYPDTNGHSGPTAVVPPAGGRVGRDAGREDAGVAEADGGQRLREVVAARRLERRRR